MHQAHKIILVGFAAFEQATLESFFRLAARRSPGYVLVGDAAQAQLAVVNADQPAPLQAAKARQPAPLVLLIGHSDGGTGWPLHKRPLNLMRVLGMVESLLGTAGTSRASPAPPATSWAMTPTVPAALMPQSERAPIGRTAAGVVPVGHSPMRKGDKADHVMVVDDSDVALKFMRNRLARYGFTADLVHSGQEALTRLSTYPYKFIFLDVMMEGMDGYQACRAIKQRKYGDAKPPVVVMLTSRGGTIDKIRGTLAGCDAYLTKPLNERELVTVLAKHDRSMARGFQPTSFGTSSSASYGAPSRH